MPSIIAINNAKNAIFEILANFEILKYWNILNIEILKYFEILANFGTMFRDEELEVEQKTEDMLKRLVLAS